MRLFLFILSFFCIPHLVDAQEINSDSLLKSFLNELIVNTTDTAQSNTYLKFAEFYKYRNQDSTLYYAQKAESSLKGKEHPNQLSRIASYRAGVFFLRGEYKKTIEIAQKGLSYLENSPNLKKNKADLLRVIGISYGTQGNYTLSLKYFLQTKQIYEDLGDTEYLRTSLNNIGVIHLKLKDFKKALDIFLELDETSPLDDPSRITIPVNLGFIYYELNELEKAEEQLNRVLSTTDNVDVRAFGLSNFKLGEIYSRKGELELAKKSFNSSLEIYTELKNEPEKVQSLNGLAIVYLTEKNFTQALSYANKALQISTESDGLPQRKTSLETLYLIEKERGNFNAALDFHEQFLILSDSLENSEVNVEIGRLTAEYEFYQFQNELLLQQRVQEITNQAKLNRQKLFLILVIVILLISALIIFFMYKSNIQKKKNNELLLAKNIEIEEKAHKLEQANSIKSRLFSILSHDLRGPLSSLSGVISLIEMNVSSKKAMESLLPEVDKRFKYTSTLLNNLLEWSHSQMEGYKVEPSHFDILEIFREKKSLLNIKLEEKELVFNASEKNYIVNADRHMIELVVQNLVANAIKYCHRNGEITVEVIDKNGEALVSITDTGIGITEDKISEIFSNNFYSTKGTENEKGTGLGLMLCRDFIGRNNGKIWVESEEGKGSTFFFTLPHP